MRPIMVESTGYRPVWPGQCGPSGPGYCYT